MSCPPRTVCCLVVCVCLSVCLSASGRLSRPLRKILCCALSFFEFLLHSRRICPTRTMFLTPSPIFSPSRTLPSIRRSNDFRRSTSSPPTRPYPHRLTTGRPSLCFSSLPPEPIPYPLNRCQHTGDREGSSAGRYRRSRSYRPAADSPHDFEQVAARVSLPFLLRCGGSGGTSGRSSSRRWRPWGRAGRAPRVDDHRKARGLRSRGALRSAREMEG